MYFFACLGDLKFNGGLLRFKVVLEIAMHSPKENLYFSLSLGDLKLNGVLLRFEVILEIAIRFWFRSLVFFGIP